MAGTLGGAMSVDVSYDDVYQGRDTYSMTLENFAADAQDLKDERGEKVSIDSPHLPDGGECVYQGKKYRIVSVPVLEGRPVVVVPDLGLVISLRVRGEA